MDLDQAFAGLSVAAISDVLRPGQVMARRIAPIVAGARVVGPAATALNAPNDILAMQYAFHLASPGHVLVVTSPGERAAWGGGITIAARARGLAGVVVDGMVRDVAEIRDHRFPTWAAGVSAGLSATEAFGAADVPLVCGDVLVHPGDLIVADDDGVVVVPRGRIDEVLVAARARVEHDRELEVEYAKGRSPFEIKRMAVPLRGSSES